MIRTYFIHGEIRSEDSLIERKCTFFVVRTYTSLFAPNPNDVLQSVIELQVQECGFGSINSTMIISFNRV